MDWVVKPGFSLSSQVVDLLFTCYKYYQLDSCCSFEKLIPSCNFVAQPLNIPPFYSSKSNLTSRPSFDIRPEHIGENFLFCLSPCSTEQYLHIQTSILFPKMQAPLGWSTDLWQRGCIHITFALRGEGGSTRCEQMRTWGVGGVLAMGTFTKKVEISR